MGVAAICGIVFGTILGIIAGAIIGFFVTKRYYDKNLRENPPITKEQIRTLYAQMGRKPTETQVNQVYYNLKNPKK